MSQENLDLVRVAREAFNRRDPDMLRGLSHEDVEFVSALAAVDADGASYHGLDTWKRYFDDMDQSWETWRIEDFEAFDGGEDRVASTFRLVGKGRHSGAVVDQRAGLAYWIRDGKLWRLRGYLDPADALEAVGCRSRRCRTRTWRSSSAPTRRWPEETRKASFERWTRTSKACRA
jgi:ketosteroid isomerase-like protein